MNKRFKKLVTGTAPVLVVAGGMKVAIAGEAPTTQTATQPAAAPVPPSTQAAAAEPATHPALRPDPAPNDVGLRILGLRR